MSLGQRLQGSIDGKGDLQSEKYEAQIRQLKLLSKSQTALLKAHLSKKLKIAEEALNKAADYLEGARPDANKARDIRQVLKSLNLQELEVDVSSTQIQLHKELGQLRAAAESGTLPADHSPLPTSKAPSPLPPSAETQKLLSSLESENAKLRDLLKEAQRELNTRAASPPPAPPAASPSLAELQRYRNEVDMLKDQLVQVTTQCQDKDAQIAQQATRLEEATRSLADTRRETALAEDLDRTRAQLAALQAAQAQAERDAEARFAAQLREQAALHEKRVSEMENAFSVEREELEQALADEVDELERARDAALAAQAAELAQAQTALRTAHRTNATLHTSVRHLAERVHSLRRDYRTAAQHIAQDLASLATAHRTVHTSTLVTQVRTFSEGVHVLSTRYRRELAERKRLHNLVQELKGNIRVFLRCRPPTAKERGDGSGTSASSGMGTDEVCVSFPNPGEVRVVNEKGREKVWEFDEVFDGQASQAAVYAEVSGLVTSVLDGYNVCIFAYGQTGSGKTFTMSGPPEARGVNTRALQELFEKLRDRAGEYADTLSVSLLEVYNEEIRDLLSEGAGARLEVKMGEFGNHVPGLTQVCVDSLDQVFALIAQADRNRSSASTNMNEHSSRSHMMLTVTLVSVLRASGLTSRGKLNLVDLAGSERIHKSGAQGQALKEAQNINKSLSALGDVIAARAQKQAHIPFRNSTLTFLLQDSLSQDSKTLMIVCISPVLYNAEETYCSLNFAARVRTVELGRASRNLLPSAGQTSAGGSTSGKATTAVGAAAGAGGARRASMGTR